MSEWRFPSNDYGEKRGINDSGIATFRGTPLRSLAREICQNSLDAAQEDAETVKVAFNVFEIPVEELPGSIVLKDTFQRCLDFWNDQKAVTTKNFFTNALDKINQKTIKMLRISDFNTIGLTGAHEEINTHWTNLTKSSGVSDKKGSAGGSFGIGKFAPFACSDFSTVFYSTYDENKTMASQGVSRLVTFTRDDGQTTQGVGYYGEERNTPVFSQMNLDPDFARDETDYGTDIYIAGYKYASENDEWEKNIVLSILDSFLGAIWNNRLAVTVGNIEISKDNLDDIISTYREELTGYTEYYYEVLKSSKTVWHIEKNFLGLGSIRLGLLLGGEEMPRKVAMIRSIGMKIKDQDRISSFITFAGVMFIDGEKINLALKDMENPEHTEWQVSRAENETQAKALLSSLNSYIRDKVKELAFSNSQDDIDVAGLGAILPDESDDVRDEGKDESVTDKPAEIQKRSPIKQTAQTAGAATGGTKDEELRTGGYVEGENVLGYIHRGKKKTSQHRKPYPADPTSDGNDEMYDEYVSIKPQKIRVVCLDKDAGKYIAVFVPDEDAGNGTLEFYLSAETESYPAHILNASVSDQDNISFAENKLTGIKFKKGTAIRANLCLDYSDYCSMEVRAYADKE